jgi:Fe(3+) dicitrate transport protein
MAGLTWDHPGTPSARLEAQLTGRQFSDPVNSDILVPDGQQGKIPAYVAWNLTASYRIRAIRTTASVAVRNLFDQRYVVDRTRGLLPGMPRMVQVGMEISAW